MNKIKGISNGVRVRFAPSPTGYLHVGGARTALFNWLYARNTGGKLILRIEDTDTTRSRKVYLDEILESLSWLKMDWDEIYYQSKRFDLYREYADRLLNEGKAYRAENGAIIYKVESGKIEINDLIRGQIEFDAAFIKDQVLIKEDKSPTYNFACVVDDALLGITHILRGDDHISNTPKQVVLYKAMGFKLPKFAHLPLILGRDGSRLSKRTGATAISDWRKMGYLPEAFTNYLLLLGWSPGNNQEIIDIKSAVKKFSIKNINKTAAVFDKDKLTWLNAQYIKKYEPEKLMDLLLPFLCSAGLVKKENFDREEVLSVVKLFQKRIATLVEFVEFSGFVFAGKVKFTQDAKKKFFERDLTKEFKLLIERFDKISDFNYTKIEEEFRSLVNELGLKAGDLVHPVRIALSGNTVGPGLFETIALLGKEKTKERLNMAQKAWKSAPRLECFVLLFVAVSMMTTLIGCGTAKGAYEGLKDDWRTAQQWDDKMKENWW
ncbi:MAG TPA: glutamate--tRNA ligase [Candidatus Omnitrophica bacterium]|nr:glutamate--tRNA ligase [Candidatus Omnitrophota bacterium]